MDEPRFKIEVHFGTVDIEERMALLPDGWATFESRRIERDPDGRIEHVTDWASNGARIKFA